MEANLENLFEGLSNDNDYPSDFSLNIIQNILWKCGEFEVLYPEPYVMRNAITNFFKTHKWSFLKMYNATLLTYNAIHNYDRTETETIETTRQNEKLGNVLSTTSEENEGMDTTSVQGTNTDTDSGSDTVSSSISNNRTGRITETNGRAAYNSSAYSPTDNKVTEYGVKANNEWSDGVTDASTGTETTAHGKVTTRDKDESETVSYGKQTTTTYSDEHNDTDNGTENVQRSLTVQGNIGVMSSQNMLLQEFNVALVNIYNIIADIFGDELCVCTF